MDFGAALLALLIGLVVKVAVLVLGARLLLAMFRARQQSPPDRLWLLLPARSEPEVRLFWWSLVLFYISELTCGIEVYVLFRSSVAISSVHAITSAVGMGLFTLALYVWADRTLIRFRDKACLLNRVCRGCTVDAPEGCKFRLLLLVAGVFVALAAVFPLFAPTERLNADPSRYILPFESLNHWYDGVVVPWLVESLPNYEPSGIAYFIPEQILVLEFRVLPLIALAVSIVGIGKIRQGHEGRGAAWVAFGFGFLSYSYFELILYATTEDVLIGSLGHEVAEFWFLVALAVFLQRAFAPQSAAA